MPAVVKPNLGLFFDRPAIDIPKQGLQDGKNFRCKNGSLESRNMGWARFGAFTLNGPVILIDNFFPRGSNEKLIFGTPTDLYLYDAALETVSYITPRYAAGTVAVSGTAVTGTGTLWLANASVGDEISFGSATQNDPGATWYTIQAVNTDTSITLTASAGTIGAGSTYTIRRKFQQTTGSSWATDVFFNAPGNVDLWFATNGLDWVITWDGTDPTVTLHPELGFTCATLATYSNMMIYGNLEVSGVLKPTSIINSDVGLPLNAGSTGTGLSEEFIVYNSADPILNLVVLGDYIVVYGSRTIVPTQFVGDPLIFIFRVAIVGIGPISAYALADFGDFHEFVGADAGYLFDGVTLKESNSHVWRDVLRQTDPARRGQTYVHFDEEQGDLIWSLPNNSDPGVGTEGAPPTIAWVEHYLEDVGNFTGSPFSKRDFPFTATGFYERKVGLAWDDITETWEEFNFAWNDQFFQVAFPLNMGGMFDGTIWTLNQTQTANGQPLPSFVRTGRFAMSSGRERDLLTRVYPYARQLPYLLDVRLFMSDFLGGGMADKGVQQFDQNLVEGLHFVVFYRRGRAAELQFGSAAGDPWILDGWDYDKANGGRR